jgi:hypothetical protein
MRGYTPYQVAELFNLRYQALRGDISSLFTSQGPSHDGLHFSQLETTAKAQLIRTLVPE